MSNLKTRIAKLEITTHGEDFGIFLINDSENSEAVLYNCCPMKPQTPAFNMPRLDGESLEDFNERVRSEAARHKCHVMCFAEV